MLYLDSSALVKRYVPEAGTDLVQNAVRSDPYVVTSIMSAVEARAAFAAAARARRVADLAEVVTVFRADWGRYVVINVNAPLIDEAADLAERHALRGYDAVQLASALAAARATSGGITFVAFDLALVRAAANEGLTLLPIP